MVFTRAPRWIAFIEVTTAVATRGSKSRALNSEMHLDGWSSKSGSDLRVLHLCCCATLPWAIREHPICLQPPVSTGIEVHALAMCWAPKERIPRGSRYSAIMDHNGTTAGPSG